MFRQEARLGVAPNKLNAALNKLGQSPRTELAIAGHFNLAFDFGLF